MFVRTDAALYKGVVESGITAARRGATLVALYDLDHRALRARGYYPSNQATLGRGINYLNKRSSSSGIIDGKGKQQYR